jgi:hypothetical protein
MLDTYPAWMLYYASWMCYSFFLKKKARQLLIFGESEVDGLEALPGEIPKRYSLLSYLSGKIHIGDTKEVMTYRHIRDHGYLCWSLFPV